MVKQERDSVNIPLKPIYKDEKIMIPYDRVVFVSWDLQTGKRLQEIRDSKGVTRPQLEAMGIEALGSRLFTRYTIKALELGHVQSVSTEILNCVLDLLDSDITELFPTVTAKNFVTTP